MKLHHAIPLLYPLMLLSILALGTWWINQIVEQETILFMHKKQHTSDYTIENFVTQNTNARGHLQYQLAASKMTHFIDTDNFSLQRPRYTQYDKNGYWTQTYSQQGYVMQNGHSVRLLNAVHFTRYYNRTPELSINTNQLDVFPKSEIIHSALPVVIRRYPGTIVHANGMHYDKKKQRLSLFNGVRIHYEKPNYKTRKSSNKLITP